MPVGIEKLNLYAGRLYLDLLELAEARGRDAKEAERKIMCESRSVYPVFEDPVTLAVNAAKRTLDPDDLKDIELLIVSTESGVDRGKPLSTWVHKFCGLPANCRTFEVKHACYGGAAALRMAALWVSAGISPGKKALVICSDLSQVHVNDPAEIICGGSAVAFLVSDNPQVLEIDLAKAGYWAYEIADTFRPTAKREIGNGEMSIYSYMDALEGAYIHYKERIEPIDHDNYFKKHIYHAPFPGMTLQAHRLILNHLNVFDETTVRESFERTVSESLYFAKRIGSSYGGSNFICLLGLLASARDLHKGDRISLFSYGSGCQGEFYEGKIGPSAIDYVRSLNIDHHLNERLRLSVEQYERNEFARERCIDRSNYKPRCDGFDGAYETLYKGKDLLVLKGIKKFVREYGWS